MLLRQNGSTMVQWEKYLYGARNAYTQWLIRNIAILPAQLSALFRGMESNKRLDYAGLYSYICNAANNSLEIIGRVANNGRTLSSIGIKRHGRSLIF